MSARRSLPAVALTLAVALVASACTNSQAAVNKNPHTGAGTASATDGVQQITTTTSADLRFHPSTITVRPGKVRIVLVNKATASGGPPHNLQVTGLPGAFVPLTTSGQTQAVTFTAPSPGSYKFVCTIHVAEGQTGTLIVKP